MKIVAVVQNCYVCSEFMGYMVYDNSGNVLPPKEILQILNSNNVRAVCNRCQIELTDRHPLDEGDTTTY